MARRRMIDPGFWDSAFAKCWSANTSIVMLAAISAADDEGRGRISSIHRNVENMMTHEQFIESINELFNESIMPYGAGLYYLPNWKTYQNICRPSPSKFPSPETASTSTHSMNGSLNDSRPIEVKGSEVKGIEGKGREVALEIPAPEIKANSSAGNLVLAIRRKSPNLDAGKVRAWVEAEISAGMTESALQDLIQSQSANFQLFQLTKAREELDKKRKHNEAVERRIEQLKREGKYGR